MTVFGAIFLPRWRQTMSSKTSRMSSAWSSAPSTASTVFGPISCPPSTSSTSSSTTARASATAGSSPSIVSRLPRSRIVHRSRSRSASSTPSPMPASSAATSFDTSRTCCTALSVGGRSRASGELFFHQLADDGAVRAARDLRHYVGHDAAEVAHARGAVLSDRVVDDLLELLFRERLRHEFRQNRKLGLLRLRLFVATAAAERLRRLEPPLALPLQDLQLLLLRKRPLQLLLGGLEAVEQQPQRVAPRGLTREHRLLQLTLHALDHPHSGKPRMLPPRMCQWRWKIVWPPPSPT